MSAFGIGTNTQKINSGMIKGKRKEIACACWFTSEGKTIPYMIKFKNDNDEIQTVKEIHVKYMEPKNYSGIPSIEYCCDIIIDSIQYEVKLIFFQDECKWVMNFL